MTLSVLALSRYDRRGASSRVRFYAYKGPLERAGITVTPAPFFDGAYLDALYAGRKVWRHALRAYLRRLPALLAARRHDLLWIEKELLPWLPIVVERLGIGGMPYVFDIDDAWYLRYREHRSALVRALCGDKLERMARGATLAIVGNDTLARWASESGARNVLALPSVVDVAHYQAPPPPEGPFTIGWIGTPQTAAYLALIAAPLREFCRDRAARLLVIGAPAVTLDGVPIVHAPWREDTEAAMLARCHIGIMPLPDDDWSRGKCGYKLIQYLASGRAVIASPVGANKTIVRPGENGFLAATDAEWRDAFAKLGGDPALCARFGAAGRLLAASEYSVSATVDPLAQALYRAAGRPVPPL
jgi:glycosyltransferase involved in cell wall biosynthesis